MQTKRRVPRLFSYGIICVAILIICQIYWYTPWRLNPLLFLIQPLLFLALPLLIAGFAFPLQRAQSGRSIVYAAILLLIGISSMPFLLELPIVYDTTSREASYRALDALEAWYIRVSIPFWFCCFMALWPLLRRRRR
jgi:hypothetical protein